MHTETPVRNYDLRRRPGLAVERSMRLEMRWVGQVRGSQLEMTWSHTGWDWWGHSTPDSKNRGKIRPSTACIVSSLRLSYEV